MTHPRGESDFASRIAFDRRMKLEFHGSSVTSDTGLLAYRELDDALGLTKPAGGMLMDGRRGRNTRHMLVGLLRQSIFDRLAGYEDGNEAERLARAPAMRWIVGELAVTTQVVSASQIGRFETQWQATSKNLAAPANLSGRWIDQFHARCPVGRSPIEARRFYANFSYLAQSWAMPRRVVAKVE